MFVEKMSEILMKHNPLLVHIESLQQFSLSILLQLSFDKKTLQTTKVKMLRNQKKKTGKFQLCIKKYPPEMSTEDIQELCSIYGKVTGISQPPKTSYIFVNFLTFSDMEKTLENFRRSHGEIKAAHSLECQNYLAEMRKKNNEIFCPENSEGDDVNTKISISPSPLNAEILGKTNVISYIKGINKGRGIISQQYDQQQTPATGCCRLCKSSATSMCGKCGDFYCSRDCQIEDWENHRYACLRKPSLVTSGRTNILDFDYSQIMDF